YICKLWSSPNPPLDRVASVVRSSAGVLALLASFERGDGAPVWAEADPVLAVEAARITGLLHTLQETELRGGAVLEPVRPPVSISYTDLKEFDLCPRCWYLRRRLKLPEAPGASQVVGRVAHAVLERFVADRMTAEAEADESLFHDATTDPAARLRELCNRFFHAEWPADQPIDYDQLDTVQAQLARYAEHLHDDAADTLLVEGNAAFTVRVGGHDHTLRAKIDRVDRAPDGSFRIIDYKTGRETKSKLSPKESDLQLGVYAMAARSYFGAGQGDEPGAHADGSLPGPLPGTAEYWILSTGNRGVISLEELALREARTLKTIEGVIEKMVAGVYERGSKCWGLCDILGEF
ncbi:MAG: PD-(D/E)XK nuclease family protein, partial [Planctomycetota bacterium]